ncbi:MAG: hypothetical protein JXA18_05275 [Chitinispirillaceae bacterium]|nr:hypothetical protein [Chitinispirillaceae bacterium]
MKAEAAVSNRGVDLKSFSDDFYRRVCSAKPQPVLDTIRRIKTRGIRMEITTLLIPEQNDIYDEISGITDFITSADPEISWHISRFFPAFSMKDAEPGLIDLLYRAKEIGLQKGLKNIYLGNTQQRHFPIFTIEGERRTCRPARR